MFDELLALGASLAGDRRISGVALAMVVNNYDLSGLGRVQLRLPWLPSYLPWARMALPGAGLNRGSAFMPQIGDEVLVAFNHGDVREPFIIGSLWNPIQRPPPEIVVDPVGTRLIRTPLGQQIMFNEETGSIVITSVTGQTVILSPAGISIAAVGGGAASLFLGVDGSLDLTASTSITLTAPSVIIDSQVVVMAGSTSVSIGGGENCSMQATTVLIN